MRFELGIHEMDKLVMFNDEHCEHCKAFKVGKSNVGRLTYSFTPVGVGVNQILESIITVKCACGAMCCLSSSNTLAKSEF